MSKWRKKPVVIEAFRMGIDPRPNWFQDAVTAGTVTTYAEEPYEGPFTHKKTWCDIETLEGTHRGNFGDYIIQGVKGELYPCKPDIFAATYESESEEG